MLHRLTLFCLLFPSLAQAQDVDVHYAPVPAWIVAMQPHAPSAGARDGLFDFSYWDNQVLSTGAGIEEYQAYRVKLLRRESLDIGNINLTWRPESGGVTVHHLRIIRDNETIDVLKEAKFSVFQPQNGIEYSILSGQRLANVQVPGLRVGDEIEFAYTIRSREIALPDNSYGLNRIGQIPASGSFRLRMTWPDGKEPIWRISDDISAKVQKEKNALEVRLDDPAALQFPKNAPPRYAFKRTLEFSDFKSWRQLSAVLTGLFNVAARLPADSRVKELAGRIKSENADPIRRARAALQLVQDEVRYVYVEMNGGNLIPATADTTWQRRYGDCKAKTVLLAALLSELGIPSRPVVVNSSGGDGINERLPSPLFFDHVLLQAEIGGKWYWLDGTRTGDIRVRTEPPDFYSWVLPLTAEGSDITPIRFVPLDMPEELDAMNIDARGGYDKPAKITLQKLIRGEEALSARAALASLPASETERRLKQLLGGGSTDVESASWKFDAETAALVLSITINDKMEWEKSDGDYRWLLTIAGAGFYPPDQRKRSGEQDANAPWPNDPHRFSCQITTIQLPTAESKWVWSHNSEAIDTVIGGVAYWRMADLTEGTMRTVMSSRTLLEEISPEEAEIANRQIPKFNNQKSRLYQKKGKAGGSELEVADKSIKEVPSATGHDWVKDASPCIAPRLRK